MCIESPQRGDIYEVKLGYQEYSILRVEKVEWDTLLVLSVAQYTTNKSSNLSEIKKLGNEAFDDEPTIYYKSELIELLKKGDIIKIER